MVKKGNPYPALALFFWKCCLPFTSAAYIQVHSRLEFFMEAWWIWSGYRSQHMSFWYLSQFLPKRSLLTHTKFYQDQNLNSCQYFFVIMKISSAAYLQRHFRTLLQWMQIIWTLTKLLPCWQYRLSKYISRWESILGLSWMARKKIEN